jgi:hypothetical protein
VNIHSVRCVVKNKFEVTLHFQHGTNCLLIALHSTKCRYEFEFQFFIHELANFANLQWYQDEENQWQDESFIANAAIVSSFWRELRVPRSRLKPKETRTPSDQWLGKFLALHLYCLTVGNGIADRQEFFLSNALVDDDTGGDEDAEGDTDDEGPRFLIGMFISILYICHLFTEHSLHQRCQSCQKKASGQYHMVCLIYLLRWFS